MTTLVLFTAAKVGKTWTNLMQGQGGLSTGTLVWNSLPESLRTVNSITTFRRRLKTHFLTFTYRDFTFIVLVVSIIVDTCIAGPVRVVVGPALNTVM